MASNLNDKQEQRDRNLSKKLLSLQEENYDTQRGWEQLAGKLSDQTAPPFIPSPIKTRGKPTTLSIWKSVAAAVVLLAAGFFTGRFSSHTNNVAGTSTRIDRYTGTNLTKIKSNNINEAQPLPFITPKDLADKQLPGNQVTSSGYNIQKVHPAQRIQSTKAKRTNDYAERSKKRNYKSANLAQPATPFITSRQGETNLMATGNRSKVQSALGSIPPQDNAITTIDTAIKTIEQNKLVQSALAAASQQVRPTTLLSAVQKSIKMKSLPVISLAEANMGPEISNARQTSTSSNIAKESIYKKLGSSNGSSSKFPIKIRL